MEIKISSSAFHEGETIPVRYTCDGEDVSPPLSWSNLPEGTRSIALICDDPDAPMGTWVHWVLLNWPAGTMELRERVPREEVLGNGARQGVNDFRKYGYGGPCPPGGTHRYYFKIYALDTGMALEGRVTKKQLIKAMEGHILAKGQLMGKYTR